MLPDRLRFEFQYTMRRMPRTPYWGRAVATPRNFATSSPSIRYDSGTELPYWRHVRPWTEVQADAFLNYGWQVRCLNNTLLHT